MNKNNTNESIIQQKGIEQSIDGIAVANMDGIITFANESWAEMHGMERSEIMGRHLGQFHNEYQLKHEVGPFNEKVFTKGRHIGYVGHIKKDGTVFPTWMSVTVVKGENDQLLGLLAVCRDVSEIKAYEAEILRQKEAAEIANTLKNEFLLKVSHELRTPMNGIIGMSELLKLTDLDDEQDEYVLLLKESSDRLMFLIDNLLEFSITEAADGEIDNKEFNINELLDSNIRVFSNSASKKGIKIIKDIDERLPGIIVNHQIQINHILKNLISNGIKFTHKGEIKITAAMDANLEKINFLKIYVSDTGIGISPENIDKVFESFIQEDSTIKREFEGMGLGLYISRLHAERLGGSLTLESTSAEGSTFCLSIPLQ